MARLMNMATAVPRSIQLIIIILHRTHLNRIILDFMIDNDFRGISDGTEVHASFWATIRSIFRL